MIHEFEVGLRRYPVGNADEKWFPVWLRRYAEFLNRTCDEKLPVDASMAKRFSRELLKNKVPAWQRLQAVRTLVAYQRIVWKTDTDDYHGILTTLGQLADSGDMSTDSRTESKSVDDVTECNLIKDFRQTLRRSRKKYETEKAYVGWVKRFLAANKTETADHLNEAKIRQFLSNLAVGASDDAGPRCSDGDFGPVDERNRSARSTAKLFPEHCGIVLRLTCWKTELTFERCKNCWDTRMFRRR